MHLDVNNIKLLPLPELRARWTAVWGRKPHARLGRTMLEKSLIYKIYENSGKGLSEKQKARLAQLIKEYKRTPTCFDEKNGPLKPGTRLVRLFNGRKYSVLVRDKGFEYNGLIYSSLSKIAKEITGTHWNGQLFFGLKGKGSRS